MKKLFILLLLFPFSSQAAGNRNLHCRSKSAELVFHTTFYGSLAIGEYTVLNGERAELPRESKIVGGTLMFFNQGRIFQVENSGAEAPLEFKLLAQLFGDQPTVLETGRCELN